MKKIAATFLLSMILVGTAFAHSGGTDSRGCHYKHKTGVYHCH